MLIYLFQNSQEWLNLKMLILRCFDQKEKYNYFLDNLSNTLHLGTKRQRKKLHGKWKCLYHNTACNFCLSTLTCPTLLTYSLQCDPRVDKCEEAFHKHLEYCWVFLGYFNSLCLKKVTKYLLNSWQINTSWWLGWFI